MLSLQDKEDLLNHCLLQHILILIPQDLNPIDSGAFISTQFNLKITMLIYAQKNNFHSYFLRLVFFLICPIAAYIKL